MRFDLLINDLMPSNCTTTKRDTSDYNWYKGQIKHTLKEFEKEVYYSLGDYKKCTTNKFKENLLTGSLNMNKQIDREVEGPNYYVYNTAGFRCSGHLSAPTEETDTELQE